MKRLGRAVCNDQTSILGAPERRNGALDFASVAHVYRVHLYFERRRHSLHGGKLALSRALGSIPKNRHARHARRDLLEQLQPLRGQAVFTIHETGNVAARPRQAIDQASSDRIETTGNTIGTVRVTCINGPTVAAPPAR